MIKGDEIIEEIRQEDVLDRLKKHVAHDPHWSHGFVVRAIDISDSVKEIERLRKRDKRMPTYKFLNNNTGEEFEDFMSISALDTFLSENPHITQLVNGAPMIHSGRGLGKPDNGFREILREVKKKNSKGISRSTINTF